MSAGHDTTVVVHGKLQYLDALRGWAILLVMAMHASMGPYALRDLDIFQSNWLPQETLDLPVGLSKLAWVGNLGVQLFFVVSAFSLTLSSASRIRSGGDSVMAFAIRRCCRIVPAFYLAIVAYTWAYGFRLPTATAEPIRARDIVLTALFLEGLAPKYGSSVVPGGWSIAEEMTFYCLLPLILSRCSTVRGMLRMSIAALVLCQLAMILSGSDGVAGSAEYYSFPSQFVVFCFGITACRLVLTGGAGFLGSVPGPFIGAGAILTFLEMIVLFPYHIVPAWLVQTHVIFAALAALLCILLHFRPTRLLVNPVTAAIGRVSFSMYLIHFALLAPSFRLAAILLGPPGDRGSDTTFFIVSLLILTVICFILSQITFHLTEDPGIRFGAWLVRVRNATRLAAGQVPPA
jgi:peptidoglycan/LPS O-acetylase OafA/YrhL